VVVCLALINAQNLNKNFNKFMKKILPILFLGILINISFINNDSAKADHYKTGIIFADPYVIGCIYDLLDASFGSKCAHRSPKYYYHEGKHKGSWNKAYDRCYNYLRRIGYRKYRNFNNVDYSVECSG
jgi:hypothetical protein